MTVSSLVVRPMGSLRTGTIFCGASQVAQWVKNLPAMQEIWARFLGQEDPLEEGKATHSSILAWRVPWTEEPGGLQSMGWQRVGHDWSGRAHRTFYSLSVPSVSTSHRCLTGAPERQPQAALPASSLCRPGPPAPPGLRAAAGAGQMRLWVTGTHACPPLKAPEKTGSTLNKKSS